MLANKIEITDAYIQEAADLLGVSSFDTERIEFIKAVKSLDLQAVPGSGKTTAVLAKLYALDKNLPFPDGSGILVISHTNAAIDEIKERIGTHCPQLIAYPNYMGTLQSFIDSFLVKPHLGNSIGTRITMIDNDAYDKRVIGQLNRYTWWNRRSDESKEGLYFDSKSQKLKNRDGNSISLRAERDSFKDAKKIIRKTVREEGILDFDTAYRIANNYIETHKEIISLLRKRFPIVIIDEMQDLDKKQYDLVELLFDPKECIVQRIGDKNQTIFDTSEQDIWSYYVPTFSIEGSHRFSSEIANIVDGLQLNRPNETFTVQSLNGKSGISPKLILYDNETPKEDVIKKYCECIYDIFKGKAGEYHVIASRTEFLKQNDKEDPDKVCLQDFEPNFQKKGVQTKEYHNSFFEYLVYFDSSSNALKPIRTNILRGFLHCLRLEEIRTVENRNYTISQLFRFMESLEDESIVENFREKLYVWALQIVNGETELVHTELGEYSSEFLGLFGKERNTSSTFFKTNNSGLNNTEHQTNEKTIDGVNLQFSSLHSVKGHTHDATLFIDSYYNRKHESELIGDLICGQGSTKNLSNSQKSTVLKTYVGFSRPRTLLCFACRKDRIEQYLNDNHTWEIIDLT